MDNFKSQSSFETEGKPHKYIKQSSYEVKGYKVVPKSAQNKYENGVIDYNHSSLKYMKFIDDSDLDDYDNDGSILKHSRML